MQGHEIKLAKSHHDVRVWRNNVENYINSPKGARLPQEHVDAMMEELDALDHLERALSRRMELLGLPV